MRLRWTVSAVEDLEHIRDYLDSHKPQLTHSTVSSIYEDIRSLKIHLIEAGMGCARVPEN